MVPVLVFLGLAGTSLYFMISTYVEDFADRSIRQNLSSLSNALYRIADRAVDELIIKGIIDDKKQIKRYKVKVFMETENFARQNEIGIIVHSMAENMTVFDTDVSDDIKKMIKQFVRKREQKFSIPDRGNYYSRSVEFKPWNWRIILVKNASAYYSLLRNVRYSYLATGFILLIIAAFLIVYLRRAIGRPINQIVTRLREGNLPEYKGISELEFLSDSFGQIMSSLQEKTHQLEATLESMSEGLTVFDSDLRLVVWNNQFIKLYNYPKDFIQVGKSYTDIIRFNVERGDYGPGNPEQQLKERVQRASGIKPDRFEVLRADGTCLEISRNPMPAGGFVTTYKDITERKQAEQELSQHRDDLEKLVSARTTELLLTNQRLEEAKLKAESATHVKSRFLATMSHELRKPLNSIIGFTRLVKRKTEDILPRIQHENLQKVLISSNDLLSLIDDILDLTRLENFLFPINPTNFPLEPLIDECLQTFEPMAKGKKLQLVKVFETDQSVLYTDNTRVKQIFVNLLDNAIKFTEKGKITVIVRGSGEEMTISVVDTGIGIPDEKQDLLFQDFQQLDDSSTRQHGGTGLGLSISRRLARLMGGDITVESRQGVGSTFIVTIPVPYTAVQPDKHDDESLAHPDQVLTPTDRHTKLDELRDEKNPDR
jgi:PAS domain S-box-containing protein